MSVSKSVLATSVLLFFSSTIALADSNTVITPSWCETEELSKTEKVICDDPILASSDILMTGLYAEVMSYRGKEGHEGHWPGEVKSNQRDWMEKRNESADREKLLDAYMMRIQALYSALQNRLSD